MATLTTLESFTGGADGADPGYGALLMDANGDLLGTTLSGGTAGGGTVFELVNTGSGYSLQTLASFDPNDTVNGNTPFAGLTADANGNLFGVTQAGGATGAGTVFELVHSGSGYSLQTLASFSGGATGAYPTGTLLADANGDLFGTTQSGGANGQGTVFEMVHSGSGYSLQTLYSFNFTDGAAPTGPLIADANGDLFGTTLQGGAGGQGTVFELVHSGSGYSLQTLASFDGSNGSFLYAGVTADGQGDLFGATYSGGSSGYGTVYELVNTGSGYAFQTIATLDYDTSGGYVIGGLTVDSQGDVFGTALAGGASSFGTVFELVHGASGYTLQTLYSFGGADGGLPEGGLLLDVQGNLYGTTAGGGDTGSGTVFEITSAAPNDAQAALALKVNGGSGNPIGAAEAGDVAFTVAGLEPGDTGVVTFTDQANHSVTVDVAAGQTHYTADFSTLTDGAVSASLQVATNGAGDSFTPVAGNLVSLDTVAPAQPGALADAAVSDGSVNAAHDTAGQTIGGTAEAGASIAVYDNGTQVATVTADNSGVWTYQVGALADGAHSYAVTAADAAGNVSAMSAALSFTVDTSAPSASAPTDAAASNGYVNASHDTAGQTIGGAVEAGASVAIYDNGSLVTTVTADNSGAWSYQVGVLADGSSHSYAVTATDAAGNTSAMSTALSFTVHGSAPGQPAAPADASVANGYVNATHDTAGQMIGGATEAGASVAIYDNGTQVATVIADDSGAWSYQVGTLADGSSHSYAVTATDAAGNVSAMSGALSFTVDTTSPAQPAAPADASAANGYVNAAHDGASQTVGGTAEAGASVALYDNGSLVTTVVADSSGAWSYQAGALADGSAHSYAVTATDAAGNTGAMSAALSFTVDVSAPAAPASLVDAAVSGGWVNAAGDAAGQVVSGTAEGGALVTVYDNGVKLGAAMADGSGAWSFTLGVLAEGAQSLTAAATDAAGNVGGPSAALTFTVDTAPPAAAVDKATVGGDGVVTVSGGAEAGSVVALYDGGGLVGEVTADAGGSWSYPVGVLADGSSHSFTVTATDAAGNASAASSALNYTAGIAAPSPPAQPTTPTDASVHNGYVNAAGDTAGQTIGGTTEAGALVTIYDHASQVTTVTADGSGAWRYQVGILADGSSHSYTVTASNAGGASAMSGALSFTVDTTPPPAPTGLADAAIAHGYVNKAHDTAGQTLTGTAEGGAAVTVYDNGVKLGTATANASTGAWSFTLGVLGDGAQSLTATATDAAGNTGAASAALAFTVDATAPVPVVTNVTDAGKGQSTVSGTSEAGSAVTLFDSGQQVGVVTAGADGTWSVSLKLNGGSIHEFTETALDLAGNAGASSGAAYWANPANKSFLGTSGDDVFIGGKGDTLTGGGGHDHFVFNTGFGKQTVTNFACGSDQLWFDHALFGNAAEVLAHAQQSGGNALITDAAGDQVMLQGVLCTTLQAGDFHVF